jgi:hypothetical protein
VVIEAGLYSRVRDLILETPLNPEETGDLAYRATFKKEQLEHLNDPKVNELCRKIAITSWLGPDKHSIFYPVRGGKEFNLVLLRPDNLEKGARRAHGDVDEMRDSYREWDETSVSPLFYRLVTDRSLQPGEVDLLRSLCDKVEAHDVTGTADMDKGMEKDRTSHSS